MKKPSYEYLTHVFLNLDDAKVTIRHETPYLVTVHGFPEAREELMGHIRYKDRIGYITGVWGPNYPLPTIRGESK